MRKLLLVIPLLLLAACAGSTGIGGIPTAPVDIADATTLDEKTAIAVETLYTAAAEAGTLAFRAGIVPVTTDPTALRDDFCSVVKAGYVAPDRGAGLRKLECQLRDARDKTRAAYEAGNGASYRAAADLAIRLAGQLLATIKGN